MLDPKDPERYSKLTSWYESDSELNSEGIGEGWAYSVLGGGKRPDVNLSTRTPVSFDNTDADGTGGDFAVPTVFNGNFDYAVNNQPGKKIPDDTKVPSWSFHNGKGTQPLLYKHLVDESTLSLSANLNASKNNTALLSAALGADENQVADYVVQLGGGNQTSVTHNNFTVPDWGTLRFDLHAQSLLGGDLNVFIKGDAPGYESFSELQSINLSTATGTGREYENDRYKIGYGTSGFETFHVDLPSSLRGKSVELKFELQGSETVYLDNVFFKSEHLKFGNPTQARSAEPIVSDANNLLLEKPQYSLSYNETTKTPNWVSWQLNKAWLGTTPRSSGFIQDTTLPNGLTQINTVDYKNTGYDRGHMLPSSQRNRNRKDNVSTFLMTNVLPQTVDNNQFFTLFPTPNPDFRSAWYNFEKYTKDLADNGKELYLVSGGYDFNSNVQPQVISNADSQQNIKRGGLTAPSILDSKGIQIPSWTWKTAVVLDYPGLGLENVSTTTPTYAIITPNTPEPTLTEFDNGGVQHPLDTIDLIGIKYVK